MSRRLRRPPTPQRAVELARSVLWAWLAAGEVRVRLRRDGGVTAAVPSPPPVPPTAVRAVRLGLRLRRASCLERSLVLQRWFLAHGLERAVVVGVAREGATTVAHAWLAGDEHLNDRVYVEMTRVPAS